MTLAEARIFLDLDLEGDPYDAYEEKLFLFKQFFTQRPIIWTTFQAKLSKLNLLQQACNTFGLTIPFPVSNEQDRVIWSDSILESFQNYQHVKSGLFHKIHHSNSPMDLKIQIDSLLNITTHYYQLWPDTGIDQKELLLSKEPDPMEILREIKIINGKGILFFKDLSKLSNSENNMVVRESMRLYLLSQKETEWKRS